MSTSPAQKPATPTKPNVAKPAVNKVATTKTVATSPAKAATNLAVKTPLKSKSDVVNKSAVASKLPQNGAPKQASNVAIKLAVPLKSKSSNGKKDANQNKKNDQKNDKKIDIKDNKKMKIEKVKMERDSFTMPKDEYAQLALLKGRLNEMGQPAKKSELLRAGIKLLAAMSDNTLKTTLAKVPVIKTGRPNK